MSVLKGQWTMYSIDNYGEIRYERLLTVTFQSTSANQCSVSCCICSLGHLQACLRVVYHLHVL
jgi:hypothetical protein